MLTGAEIAFAVSKGEIEIDPWEDSQLNPNSYNLRLGERLLVYKNGILDCRKQNDVLGWIIPPEGILLHPGRIYLGHTVEIAGSDHYIPCIEGRSSVGRLGISIHATAGFGDIGFRGQWTLELSVIQPVRVYAGLEICQINFQVPIGDITLYKGRYRDQFNGPVASRI